MLSQTVGLLQPSPTRPLGVGCGGGGGGGGGCLCFHCRLSSREYHPALASLFPQYFCYLITQVGGTTCMLRFSRIGIDISFSDRNYSQEHP